MEVQNEKSIQRKYSHNIKYIFDWGNVSRV